MAGRTNQDREEKILSVFLDALREAGGPPARVIAMRDKPDAEIEILSNTGQRVGVEITELLESMDGRDRSLEALVCAGIKDACQKVVGPSGFVDVQILEHPRDRQQAERWLQAFSQWLNERRSMILADGILEHDFPPDAGLVKARLEARQRLLATEQGTEDCSTEVEHAKELELANDLNWLRVRAISVDGADGAWHVGGFPGGGLADQHAPDIDQMVFDAVENKCQKAPGFAFGGELWLVVRNPFKAEPSEGMQERLGAIPGIEGFAQVWLLTVPANVLDPRRPPAVRRLR